MFGVFVLQIFFRYALKMIPGILIGIALMGYIAFISARRLYPKGERFTFRHFMGINPVHFGVVVVINMMIGLFTPPMGMLISRDFNL